MLKANTPLFLHACRSLIVIFAMVSLSGCITTRGCYGRDYCLERDGPRQYIRAPDGWGGKYCLQNPTEC